MGANTRWKGTPWIAAIAAALLLGIVLFHLAGGKIQSGTGSDEEIHRYYDHFREVSEDYIECASTGLAEYGEKLPERDRGLYELSVNMHRTRLAELPRRIDEAPARKREQDQRRGQWRRNEGNN